MLQETSSSNVEKSRGEMIITAPSQCLFMEKSPLKEVIDPSMIVKDRYCWIMKNLNITLGLGPFYRFPSLSLSSSSAFIYIYIIVTLAVGVPLAYLEAALGQSTRRGVADVFQLCAAIEGLRVSMAMYCFILPVYYASLFSYALFYLYHSLTLHLPWSDCTSISTDDSEYTCVDSTSNMTDSKHLVPTQAFWVFSVLQGIKTDDEQNRLLGLNEPLVLGLAIAWFVIVLLSKQSIRSRTILLEYIFIPILLFLLVLMVFVASHFVPDNSSESRKSLVPKVLSRYFSNLKGFSNVKVWRVATEQVLFSHCIATGPLIRLGSVSYFKSPLAVDAAAACIINLCFTITNSIVYYFGAVLFLNDVKNYNSTSVNFYEGAGGFFIPFSRILCELPLAFLWSGLFFFLFFMMGTRAMMGVLDTSVSIIRSYLPNQHRMFCSSFTVSVCVCVVSFLLGLLCITKKDILVFYVLDSMTCATVLPVLALVECIGVVWFYGLLRFAGDVQFMLGFKPHLIAQTLWFLIPIYLLFIIATSWSYSWTSEFYLYYPLPSAYVITGWLLVLSIILPIPIKLAINCREFYKRDRLREVFKSRDDLGPDELELKYQDKDFFSRVSVVDSASLIAASGAPTPATSVSISPSPLMRPRRW